MHTQVVATDPAEVLEDITVPKRESDISAWVNVIYGCNEKCSYCVVPYTRWVSIWELDSGGGCENGNIELLYKVPTKILKGCACTMVILNGSGGIGQIELIKQQF
eukprot:scaffold33646_cov21-Tisochrysis_lutea.AAC.2